MARYRERKLKNGKTVWDVEIVMKDGITKAGKRIYKTYPNKTIATQEVAKIETYIREGKYDNNREKKQMTLSELIDKFIKIQIPKNKPKEQTNKIHILNWWKSEIGDYYLYKITPSLIIDYQMKLCEKKKEVPIINKKEPRYIDKQIAPSTINKYLQALRVVFNFAIELDILDKNPVQKVKKLKENNVRTQHLSEKQIKLLLDTCKQTDYKIYLGVLIAIELGTRRGEIEHFTWADIDFDNNTITSQTTKNGECVVRPLPPVLAEELKNYKKQFKVRSLKNDFLFANPKGTIDTNLFGKNFKKIVDKCGFDDFHFHDLKGTFATLRDKYNMPEYHTQKMAGHKTREMTQRYTKINVEYLRQSENDFESILLGNIGF